MQYEIITVIKQSNKGRVYLAKAEEYIEGKLLEKAKGMFKK